MSVVAQVFNRGVLKLLLALAIPASIAWFFLYSQQQADKQISDYKKEQKANPTTDRVIIKDYGLKEVDDSNHIRWQLLAAAGVVSPDNQNVTLEDVKVEYYDSATKALKMRLIAPTGTANQSTRYVKLTAPDGKYVIAEGEGGKSKFQSKVVELIKKNQFLASGGVIIDWPGVAKVSGNSASGSIDLAAGPKNFKIVGNTHAEIAVR